MDGIEEILKIYEKRIYAFFLKHIKMPATAEDLTQDVLMKIWIRRKSLENIQNLDNYVFSMAKNHVIDHLRKAKTNRQYKDALQREIAVQQPLALDKIIYSDYKVILDKLLNDLPPRQKEIFLLSRMKGLSHDEIADQLNISTKTVRNHLFLAMKHIRSHMNTDTIGVVGMLAYLL